MLDNAKVHTAEIQIDAFKQVMQRGLIPFGQAITIGAASASKEHANHKKIDSEPEPITEN